MELNREEKEMLNGKFGPSKRRAMELLYEYGKALGAEKLVATNNVHMLIGFYPYPEVIDSYHGEALVSKFFLDSDEPIEIDRMESYNTTHIWAIDLEKWKQLGASEDLHRIMEILRNYSIKKGISISATCTPYQVGNLPMRGEHCAWTESSAVPFCNSILGARTNVETAHSAYASALTGKIPLSGFHLDNNRLATHQVDLLIDLTTPFHWNLFGYYIGEKLQLGVPAVKIGSKPKPDFNMIKGFNAAIASSGGVQMYHIEGFTPEAPTIDSAFGGGKPQYILRFNHQDLIDSYEMLNSGNEKDVQLVILGCPHYSVEQLFRLSRMLEGRKISPNTRLWIWTARQIKEIAVRNGYAAVIEKSGAELLSDSCPLVTKGIFPKDAVSIATDSAKQAHYAPAITGCRAWMGTMQDCVEAAITGKFKGEQTWKLLS